MRFLYVVLASIFSLLVLLLMTKLIGYRQVSSMSLYDYVNSITIGSIAAQMAVSTGEDLWICAVAMVIYGAITYLFAVLSNKSHFFRKVVVGHPIVLVDNGKIYDRNFPKARLDLDEFEAALRAQGYFDVSKIHTAVMEANGKISVLLKSGDRPATPNDLSLGVAQERLVANVIVDGVAMEGNLRLLGRDSRWLQQKLKACGISDIHSVFLGVCPQDGEPAFYIRVEPPKTNAL